MRLMLEGRLDDLRKFYDLGDYRQVMVALKTCVQFGLALPDWVSAQAEDALAFYYKSGGASGRGKRGGNLARHNRAMVDRRRHKVAEHELARRSMVGGNRDDAFERASDHLRGTFAQGSADAISKSHGRVQRALKRLKGSSHPQ